MNYLGEYTQLYIDRFTSVGAFLTDKEEFEVLLPNKYLEDNLEIGGSVRVFIYKDSEDRPVATTETPKLSLHQFAYLKAKSIEKIGAFLDWGLEKDLLVPFKEQNVKMVEEGTYLIRLVLDEKTDRLIGSAKINKFLTKDLTDLKEGEQVNLFIANQTDLGRKVIVNHQYDGLIFTDRITQPLHDGQEMKGFIEGIREDGKLDISLVPVSYEKFDFFSKTLLDYLQKNNGEIEITDKSSPELIRSEVGMSKKSFKKAVGNLYKKKRILLKKTSIELIV